MNFNTEAIPEVVIDDLAQSAAMLKMLSDPNRLRIFAQLMRGDTCNCELVARLGIPANLLSHHLKVLSEAGLVKARRDRIDGRWIYYSADKHTVDGFRRNLNELLDTSHIEVRGLCGPEGQCSDLSLSDRMSCQ